MNQTKNDTYTADVHQLVNKWLDAMIGVKRNKNKKHTAAFKC
jgi:hypothetical protein